MIMASLGERDTASASAAAAREAAREEGGEGTLAEVAVAEARVALLVGDPRAALAAATEARDRAERCGTYEARLHAFLASADASEAAGEPDAARRWLGEARGLLDDAANTLAPAARARLREVGAYRKALSAVPQVTSETAEDDGRWRRLAFLARRLTAERRVGRLYEEIVDAAIELSGAERGFLILREDDGRLRVRVAREVGSHKSLDHEFSRSIAARAIDGGQAVSTVDALRDERMDGAASVHALSLRSVMAVPLRRRGDVRGAIYLEDRLRPSAFGPADLALIADLADLAAIALHGAVLLRAERRTSRRLSVLRRRLARTVETQAIELASLKRAHDDPGAELPGMVAHSTAMRRALALVLRVAAAEVPVLVTGESGTGKELVARAIHERSPRREAPFVSENCGAIPEPLLESALFGHVRGAFTGADRARVGLFEAADGGTLFLDEIGEMSPGMQAKLLRAVQDGEIRAVGGEATRHVNVRIVAATHRDLEEMVRDGRFREDLYYRIAVVVVRIPPLRERTEDVAPLVACFVARHAPNRDVRFDRKALARLATYDWPGNVRQLENEVQRALVMGADVVREEDLSPAVRGDTGSAPDELDLKAQVAVLERRLIRRALDASDANQTQAAKVLGVSRYGLQKMMKRLEI
jgi:transcriptional regulator with GAF, ATPase, and Fis domain